MQNETPPSPREVFTGLVSTPDEVDVLAAGLWIAAEHVPGLDVGAYRRRYAHLAELAASALEREPHGSLVERLRFLNRFFQVEQRFQGDMQDYYDPQNSFLSAVLDRRRGIPISLAVVYEFVARRCGVDVGGVNFPGHFLLDCRGESGEQALVDPFHFRLLTLAQARELFHSYAGEQAEFSKEMLRRATSRQVLRRMLTNLKHIYLQRSDFVAALDCVERLLLLAPDAWDEIRDRGLIYARLQLFGPARQDLQNYLRHMPEAQMAPEIGRILTEIAGKNTAVH